MSAEHASEPAGRSFSRVATYEAGIWRSLYRWLTRRPRSTDPEAALFGCACEVTPILIAFIVVSALEIPIVSLIFPWPAVRDALLVLGVWSLIWMFGLLAALRVHPHVLAKEGLEIRSGFQFNLRIAWDRIANIRLRHSSSVERKLQIEHSESGATLAVHGTCNIEVTLRAPTTVEFSDGRRANVDALRFYADEPSELVAAARSHLALLPACPSHSAD
jgi:hypothetical protein